MSWERVEEVPPKPVRDSRARYRVEGKGQPPSWQAAESTTGHVVWRCRKCKRLAVTGGGDPGQCLMCPR